MTKFIAAVEQAQDGSWTAAVIGEHTVLGTGISKEDALDNLRDGVQGLMEYLAAKGLPLPNEHVEFVELEVAA
jgi:predicted RNase H-like HicB family nuclease